MASKRINSASENPMQAALAQIISQNMGAGSAPTSGAGGGTTTPSFNPMIDAAIQYWTTVRDTYGNTQKVVDNFLQAAGPLGALNRGVADAMFGEGVNVAQAFIDYLQRLKAPNPASIAAALGAQSAPTGSSLAGRLPVS
jgi:hypothetical protein